MPQPKLSFNRAQGGLGRGLPGEDHISGIVFYSANLPAGFSSTVRERTFYSVAEAVAAGIVKGSANHAVDYYHIAEFFRLNPQGVLHVGYYDVPGTPATHTYTEIKTLQVFALGKIRQMAVYLAPIATGVVSANITALHARAVELFGDYMPLVVLVGFDIAAITDLSTLADLRALTAHYVTVVIGEDGGADGAALAATKSFSITALGAALGTLSKAPVHESIAWVKKYPVAESELDVPSMGNGQLVRVLSKTLLDGLTDKGYLFAKKFVGRTNSYWNDTPTSVAATSDFAYIESNRTVDKAVRTVYARLSGELNGPVLLDASGKLSNTFVEYLKGEGDLALNQMAQDGELSAYQTLIDPAQNVASTSKVVVTMQLVPIGVARTIEVNIGLTASIT